MKRRWLILLIPGALLLAILWLWRSRKQAQVAASDQPAPGYPFGSAGWQLEQSYGQIPPASTPTAAQLKAEAAASQAAAKAAAKSAAAIKKQQAAAAAAAAAAAKKPAKKKLAVPAPELAAAEQPTVVFTPSWPRTLDTQVVAPASIDTTPSPSPAFMPWNIGPGGNPIFHKDNSAI
jgi:hypothetical protein